MLPFLPSFGAIVYQNLGPRWGLLALAIPIGLFTFFIDGGSDWMWLALWAAMGPVFVEAMARGRTLNRAMAGAVATTVVLQCLILLIISAEKGVGPWTLLGDGIEATILVSLEIHRSMGAEPQTLQRLESAAPMIARAIASVVPGIVIAMDLMAYWLTLLIYRKAVARIGGDPLRPEILRKWSMPYPWVWMTIGAGILLLLPVGILKPLGANILIVMGTLHFLQGIAIVASFFEYRRTPAFIKVVFYILIFFQQPFVFLVVMVLGLFDIWFDFRRRWASSDIYHGSAL